jgi:hypothetical protein
MELNDSMIMKESLYNEIKQELEQPKPSQKKIISSIIALSDKNFDVEFYRFVVTIFQLNPNFYMEFIYPVLRENLRKQYGAQKIIEMETYILKNFCLAEGEEILYVYNGNIQERLPNNTIKVLAGILYVTPHRIIAQGRLKITPSEKFEWLDKLISGVSYGNAKAVREKLFNASIGQGLPCYGYTFALNKLFNLRHDKTHIRYDIIHNSVNLCNYTLSLTPSKTQKSIDNLIFLLQNNKRDTFSGKQFRFTGFTVSRLGGILSPNYAKDLVKALGGKINDTGAKSLNYLITNKPKAKYLKLQERGTIILTDREFLDLLEG